MSSSDSTQPVEATTADHPETPPTPETVSAVSPPVSPEAETSVPASPAAAGAPEVVASAPEPRAPAMPALPPQPVPQVPPAPQPHDLSRIAQDLQIRKAQVEAVVQLLDEENTVPFITRYRKERTGGLNEEAIRRIQERAEHLRELANRKQTILKSIAGQGRLNDDLTQAILAAESPKRLEDLYLPFKPKKKSHATEAREKGLGPIAEAIWNADPAVNNLAEVLPGLVDPDKWLLSTDEVLAGIKHILADMVSDAADARGPLRNYTWDTGLIVAVKVETLPEGKGKEYEPYFNFQEPVKDIPPHRVLAINRGEKANALRVRVETDVAMANEIARYHLNFGEHPHRELLVGAITDALDRLLLPGLEREVRRELTERAQEHAVLVFARNLRSLLLQPPLRGKKVLAVDPGIRTGCKLAVLDETGKLLDDAVVFPHGQKKNQIDAKRKIEQLVRMYQITVVAIGNGTGCREAEQLVADLIADLEQRRLNPTPTAPATITEASSTPVATVPPAAPEPVNPPAEASSPVIPEVPSSQSIVSETPALQTDSNSITSQVTISSPPVETTGVAAPSAETLTTGAVAAPAMPPLAPPPPPLHPPVSLEGLPDAPTDLAYVIVIEAGASDYSASLVAREEFPELDATTRGTISIGRRLQDPLAELVKIDPQHIGVGLYQHDVKQKHLKESLEAVIESSVNSVGVDLNTASVPLLRHVSGLNQLVAREVVTFREKHGKFTGRAQLLEVSGLGEKRFTQSAGFLKIPDGPDPLDSTWIHPESYPLARQILADLGFTSADLRDKVKLDEIRSKFNGINLNDASIKLNVGESTVRDILDALAKPGRDPREDLPPPIFKKGVLKLEDISQGMELKGTVLNVVPFGAFVDIGLKESGLVHISQMANRYIKSPYDVVSVGDVIIVWVMEVKAGEKKISLSMIPPGQERGRGGPPQQQRGDQRDQRGDQRDQRGDQRGDQRDNRGEQRGDRGQGPGGPPQQQQPQQQGDRPQFGGGQQREERPAFAPRGDRPGFQPRGGQGQGQGQGQQGQGGNRFGGGPGNRGPGGPGGGRGPGGPPPRQGVGGPVQQPPGGIAPQSGVTPPAPPVQPPPPPKKPPGKPKPLPNLSAEKKSGKSALNTFAELAAFFKKEEPKPEPKPEEPKPAETPAAESPPTETVVKPEEPKPAGDQPPAT